MIDGEQESRNQVFYVHKVPFNGSKLRVKHDWHRTCTEVFIRFFGTDQVADVTGAGDTVLAVLTAALAAGSEPLEAAQIANIAAGLVVMKLGTATLSAAELRAAITTPEAAE